LRSGSEAAAQHPGGVPRSFGAATWCYYLCSDLQNRSTDALKTVAKKKLPKELFFGVCASDVCASDVCASDVCASDVCASDVCASDVCASALLPVAVAAPASLRAAVVAT